MMDWMILTFINLLLSQISDWQMPRLIMVSFRDQDLTWHPNSGTKRSCQALQMYTRLG